MENQPRVTVKNIVAKFNVGKPLNIQVIAWVLFTVQNRVGFFDNRSLRLRTEELTVRFFDSGKAVVFNVKSLENLRNRCKNAAQIVQTVAFSGFHNYRLVSIIGTGKIHQGLNLGRFATLYKEIVSSVENDTAKCDLPCFGTVVRVHKTGSLVAIGKNLTNMELAVLKVEKMAADLQCDMAHNN